MNHTDPGFVLAASIIAINIAFLVANAHGAAVAATNLATAVAYVAIKATSAWRLTTT